MNRVTIEIGKGSRVVIYPDGTGHLENYIPGCGWCMNTWDSVDWPALVAEAQQALARVGKKAA